MEWSEMELRCMGLVGFEKASFQIHRRKFYWRTTY